MDTLMVIYVLHQVLYLHNDKIAYISLTDTNYLTIEFKLEASEAFKALDMLSRLSKGKFKPPKTYMPYYVNKAKEYDKLDHSDDELREIYDALLQVLRSDPDNHDLCNTVFPEEKDIWTISAGQRWEAAQEAKRQAILEGRQAMLGRGEMPPIEQCDRVYSIDDSLITGGAPDLLKSKGRVMPGVADGTVVKEKKQGWEEKRLGKDKEDAESKEGLCSRAENCVVCGACLGANVRMYTNMGYKVNEHYLIISWSTVPAWIYKNFWKTYHKKNYDSAIKVTMNTLLRWCEQGYGV